MLNTNIRGDGPTTIFFLHWLSGSGASWSEVTHLLSPDFRCIEIDLPGFGASAVIPGYTVEEMAQAVIEVIEAHQGEVSHTSSPSWLLAGHSMGCKVSCVIARYAENGAPTLKGLKGVVLAAGSPPSPEPMSASRRSSMLQWFTGASDESHKQAKKFIEANSSGDLSDQAVAEATSITLQMNGAAWRAWLDAGSREDWAARVGVLRTPAIIIAGQDDPDLGPAGQQEFMLPHFAQADLRVIANAKHLLPLEAPAKLAAILREASTLSQVKAPCGPVVPASYLDLINSDRVSSQTRNVLLARAQPDDPAYNPVTLTPVQLSILRAVAARIVPQAAATDGIALEARVDRNLTNGPGNGWRYDILPSDADSYRLGLDTLNAEAKSQHKQPFVALTAAQQNGMLESLDGGSFGAGLLRTLGDVAMHLGLGDTEPGTHLTTPQMKRWFEEMRGDLARAYMAHPETFARIGYSGIADGADAETQAGFKLIGIGEREPWEPQANPAVSGKTA